MFTRLGRGLAGRLALTALALLGTLSGALALESETSAYLARCSPTPEPYFAQAADAFIKSGKEAGWWDSVIGLYFFCAPTQQAALINVKGPTLPLTVSGSVQFTPYTGMKGDGSTGFLDTGSTPANIPGFGLNSHSIFVYSQTDSDSLAADVGATNGGSTLGIRLHYGTNASIWSANPSAMTFSNTTGMGLSGFVRSDTNTGYWVHNDATMTFPSTGTTVGIFPTSTFRFLRQGASTYYSANQLAFGIIGSGSMTQAQAAQIYPACVAMLATLGTWNGMEPEMQSYIDRCPSDTPWDPKFVIPANQFIKEAKASGWWSHMADVHFFCAPTVAAAIVNVKGDTMHLTVSGSVTMLVPYEGLSGVPSGSTSGYLMTGSTAAQIPGLSLNSNSMFVFCQTDAPSLASEMGSQGGSSNLGIRARNAALGSVWSTNTAIVNFNVDSARGLTGFVRSGSAGINYVKYHVQQEDTDGMTFKAQPSGALPTGQVNYLRMSTSAYYSRNELAFGFIGDGTITATQTQDMYNSCMEMLGDGGLGTLQSDSLDDATFGPNAFGRAFVNSDPTHAPYTPTTMHVIRVGNPPTSDSMDFVGTSTTTTAYKYGPLTDVMTRPWGVAATSTDTQVDRWEQIWSDRAMVTIPGTGNKPNDVMSPIDGAIELANDSFSDNDRSTQSLPSSIAWYGGSGTDLAVSGSAMTISPGGSALGYFTSTAAPQTVNQNDHITVRFTLIVSGTSLPSTPDFFRVALLNSFGTATNPFDTGTASRAAGDGYSASVTSHYGGFMFTAPLAGTSGTASLKDYVHVATSTTGPMDTASYTQVSTGGKSGGAYGFLASQTYMGALDVLQKSDTVATETLSFSGSFANGTTRSWTWNRPDTTGTDHAAFDTVGFYSGSSAGTSLKIDNVAVEYYSSRAPISCRTEFTTYDKAIGSTVVKTAYSSGMKFRQDPDYYAQTGTNWGWGDIAEAWGYNVDAWQTRWNANQNDPIFTQDMDVDMGDISHYAFYSDPGHTKAVFTYDSADGGDFKTTHDRVVLGLGRLADITMAKGFIIDLEHSDGRSTILEQQFLNEMKQIAHCKKSLAGQTFSLGEVGDRIGIGSGGFDGWSAANLNELDWCSIVVMASPPGSPAGTATATLNSQYDFFTVSGTTAPLSKICVSVQIGAHGQEISLPDTIEVRDWINTLHPGITKCFISPNNAEFGGPLSRTPNQVIATLLNLPTH